MGEEKRPFGVRLDPDLKAALERQAKREKRSPANLGEVLLEWAMRQLNIAGNSIALLELDVTPEGTMHIEPKFHTSTPSPKVTNEQQLIDERVEMGAEIVNGATESKPKKIKTHRSKAS